MLNTLRRAKQLDVPVPIDLNFWLDVKWWLENLENWNGVSFLEFSDFQNKIALDASTDGWLDGGPGLSGYNYMLDEFFMCGIPTECAHFKIADLELLAHLLCARVWGPGWSGLKVWGLTDNKSCELFLKNGRSRINHRVQMSRLLTSMEHRWHFLWFPDYIRSEKNILPDCGSRWRDPERRQTFWATCCQMGVSPQQIPIPREYFDIYNL